MADSCQCMTKTTKKIKKIKLGYKWAGLGGSAMPLLALTV